MKRPDHKRQHLLLEIMNTHGASSSQADIDELLRPWRRLAARLAPLVGERGFCALFVRASSLSLAQFDWLAAPPACKTVEPTLARLGDTLRTADPLVARSANTALLDTFTRLLADLIGQALADRLLDAPAGGAEEKKQEHK